MARLNAVLLAAALTGACVTSTITFGNPLPDASGLQVGVSTRRDVLATLGPPDEFSRATPWVGRVFDPQVIRVEDEHELFGRRHYTWVRETRHDDLFLGWLIFNYDGRQQSAERLMVMFDDQDRVSGIGRGPLP